MHRICNLFFKCLLIVIPYTVFAKGDHPWKQAPEFSIAGYLDIFYAYDFNKPETVQRQPFFFNHNRHNEYNINHGIFGLGIDHSKYRINLALHTGTYPNDNYSAEPDVLKNIFEANIGLSLNKKSNLWLDAGVFSSFIGFESPLSIDNKTLTRSISAESSPYYLTGVKVTYNLNEKWGLAGSILNGWQYIQKVEGNSLPSFGTQVLFKTNEKYSFNWSTFIGTDDPDATRRMRYFNNFYGQFQFTDVVGLIAGFDIGAQQQQKGSSSYDMWYAFTLVLHHEFTEKWGAAVRGEYYRDENGVIIPSNTLNGFNTSGFSVNADYKPLSNLACRFEARLLKSAEEEFEKDGNPTNSNFFIVTSIAYKLKKKLN
jgi:hypothetical protein